MMPSLKRPCPFGPNVESTFPLVGQTKPLPVAGGGFGTAFGAAGFGVGKGRLAVWTVPLLPVDGVGVVPVDVDVRGVERLGVPTVPGIRSF